MPKVSAEQRRYLDSIYYDTTGRQGAFSSAVPLLNEARKDGGKNITLSIVKQYLKSAASYQLHQRALRKHPRRSLMVRIGAEREYEFS